MNNYIIFSEFSYIKEWYKKQFINNQECIQWIENTLDLSQNWKFKIIKSYDLNNSTKYWDIKARNNGTKLFLEYRNKITGDIDTVIKPIQEVMIENIPSYKEPIQ